MKKVLLALKKCLNPKLLIPKPQIATKAASCLAFAFLFEFAAAQPPSISYTSPQVLARSASASITPVNAGGTIPAGWGYKKVGNQLTSGLDRPAGLCMDAAGNIYLADTYNHVIKKITTAGTVSILAGVSGSVGVTEGAATSAKFRYPSDVALNADETILYICDKENHAIRQLVLATAQVSTIAGSLNTAGDATGSGTTARFRTPQGIVVAGGALYVTDLGNEKIKKIELSGSYAVSLTAGSGTTGGTNHATGSSATFSGPQGITADASYLYVTEFTGQRIRKISLTAPFEVTTLAGSGTAGVVNATGTAASFRDPKGITIDGQGNLYVADQGNNRIRKITSGGVVTTLAGSGTAALTTGDSTAAAFNGPADVFINATGLMYVADQTGDAVRMITLNGYLISSGLPAGLNFNGSTGEISGTPTAQTTASNYIVTGYNYYGSSQVNINITVADLPTITTTDPTSILYSTAVSGGNITSDGGSAVTARGVVWSTSPGPTVTLTTKTSNGTGTGNFSSNLTGLNSGTVYYIRAYATNAVGTGYGAQDTFTTSQSVPVIGYEINDVIFSVGSPSTTVSVTNSGGTADVVQTATIAGGSQGFADGVGTAAKFNVPYGIVTDSIGNLYVSEWVNHRIRKIVLATRTVTTIAGGVQGNLDGIGTSAKFSGPAGLALDGQGNLYVADAVNHSIRKLELSTRTVSTVAGAGTFGSTDGTGLSAKFFYPRGIALDDSGYLYVSDQGNHTIRRVFPDTRVVQTVAGIGITGQGNGYAQASTFNAPNGITYAGSGVFYIVDGNNMMIRKLDMSSRTVSLLAGGTPSGYLDGTGSAAKFNSPAFISSDLNGHLYLSDGGNHRIRKIVTSTAVVTTLAGSGSGTVANGAGSNAKFNQPLGIAHGPNGQIYVTENHAIRSISRYRIDPELPAGLVFDGQTGVISGTPTAAMAAKVYTVYAQNSAGSATATITLTTASAPAVVTGVATSVTATTATLNGTVNANGTATSALTIKYATDTTVLNAGGGTAATLSVTSATGNTVTSVTGAITGLTANTSYYFRISATNAAGTSNGSRMMFLTAPPPPNISYSSPNVALSAGTAMGAMTIANAGGSPEPMQVIRYAGNGTNGYSNASRLSASFTVPIGACFDGNDGIYVVDRTAHRIRKITLSTGMVTVVAGSGSSGSADGIGTSASFSSPNGIVTDGAGHLFVADMNNHRIRKILLSTGQVTTLSGSTSGNIDGSASVALFTQPQGIAMGSDGYLYVPDQNMKVRRVDPATGEVTTVAGSSTGSEDGVGTSAKFSSPNAITADGSGNLYITEVGTHRIRKLNISSRQVTTIAGTGSTGFQDGIGTSASFYYPSGIAINTAGELFITDQANHSIRKISPSNGLVTTLAGNGKSGKLDGAGTAATFSDPTGSMAVDAEGNLYVTDKQNYLIRKISKYSISPALPVGLTFNTATGTISGTPTALSAATTYTVTASNTGGTSTTTFTLSVSSSLMTTEVSAIGSSTASSGGVVDASFSGVTARGVVWSTSPTPTTSLATKTNDGTGTGTFTSAVTGLTANTTYYLRAYAVHSGGTDYGSERSFTTNRSMTITDVTKTYGDADFAPTAPTSNSSGAWTYSSGNTSVATVNSGAITIAGAGTSAITASQAAAGAYAASTTTFTLTVNKAEPTITLIVPGTTTLAAANNMPITASASNGETVTIAIGSGTATGTLTPVSAGSYTLNGVSATGNLVFNATTAATATHAAGSKTVTMDVTRNNQTITFNALSAVSYSNGLTQTLTATSSSGETVSFAVISGPGSVTGTALTITGPGTILIRASQTGTASYNAAPNVERSLLVNPGVPSITDFSPTSATLGDTITITGQYFTNVSSVRFGGRSAGSYTVVDASTIRAVVDSGATGVVSVTTTGGTDTEAGFRYKVMWMGSTNAFTSTGNWSGGRVPQTDDDIIFSPTAASDLELDASKTVGNVDFNGSGRSLNLGAYNLTVKGNLTMPGNIAGSGKLIMGGTTAQMIRGGGTIPDLEINNSTGVTIDATGDELTVSGTLRSTSGTLTTNGKLRLTSNSGGTARVGVVGGTISGNVIAERYVQQNQNSGGTGRAWRLVSVPVTGTGTLRDFFMNGRPGQDLTLTASRDAESDNSGTPIVGHNYATASDATTAGFDWIGVANQVSSLRFYTGSAGGGSFASENVPTMTTDYANAAQGYMVFSRGDRKLEFPSTTSAGATTFRSTGALKTGNQSVTIQPASTSKFTLVGNPYMSVLDLSALYTSNSSVIEPSFWIWDANMAGTNYQGGYVNVYLSGSQWVTNTGSYINPELIESGMAFFAEPKTTLSAAGTLTITESHKSSASSAGLSPFATDQSDDHGRIYVRMERADDKGQRQLIDGVMADFHSSFKTTLGDLSDREKLRNGISRGALWLKTENKLLSSEGLPWPKTDKRSIPLYMSGVGDQTLIVRIDPRGMRDRYVQAWLKDNVLKRQVEINMNAPTDYDFIGTGSAAWDSTRFEIVYVEAGRPSTGVTLEPDDAAEEPSVKLYPNPSKSADVKLSLRAMTPGTYSIQVLDMTGRLVATTSLSHRSLNGEYRILEGRRLSPGSYIIRLSDQDKQPKETLRLIVE